MGFGRSRTFRRVAAVAAFQMAFLGLASNLLFLAAFRFRFGWLVEPELAVAGGTTSAELLRWAALTDAAGYYVPMVPIAVVWWVELRPRRPLLMDLGAAGAILFAVAGATAAVILAIQDPP
jgi:hypothetical protein